METHLKHFLDYYKGTESPGYAVFVTGEWGSGKTFQVKRCLSEEERWYVSLFGLESANAIHSAILAEIVPLTEIADFAEKHIEKVGLPPIFNAIPGIVNTVLRKRARPSRVLVIDDIERSNIPLRDIGGIINHYVEHKGFRVVIIGNNNKTPKKFGYIQEKVIGRTIYLTPQVDEALEAFLSEEKDPCARNFLHLYKDLISDLFQKSKVESLRILRHVIQDIRRLYRTIDKKYSDYGDAMEELLGIFIAMNIEFRADNITKEDLQERVSARLKNLLHEDENIQNTDPPFVVSESKYQPINFQSDVMSDPVLFDLIVRGKYIQNDIHEMLESSSWFMDENDLPPWKIVIHFDDTEDERVDAALQRMLRQFEDRSILNPGDMLHTFCLMMLMAENSTLQKSVDDIRGDCVGYIDDLYNGNLLIPSDPGNFMRDEYQGFGGHAYWVAPDSTYKEHFNEIKSYLKSARDEVLEKRTLPQIANELLGFVADDEIKFDEVLRGEGGGEVQYFRAPVLKYIEPERFVDAWLKNPIKNKIHIKWALDGRYEPGGVGSQLADEKQWASEVYRVMKIRAGELSGYRGLRVNRLIPKYFRELFEREVEE